MRFFWCQSLCEMRDALESNPGGMEFPAAWTMDQMEALDSSSGSCSDTAGRRIVIVVVIVVLFIVRC